MNGEDGVGTKALGYKNIRTTGNTYGPLVSGGSNSGLDALNSVLHAPTKDPPSLDE